MQALSEIAVRVGGEDVGVSVVTLMGLAHGAAHGDTSQRREPFRGRRDFPLMSARISVQFDYHDAREGFVGIS